MRAFLNAILSFIGAESLTDGEFESIELDEQAYNQETYDALAEILEARESVSSVQEQLVSYFSAKGVSVTENETAQSNIFIGGELECE